MSRMLVAKGYNQSRDYFKYSCRYLFLWVKQTHIILWSPHRCWMDHLPISRLDLRLMTILKHRRILYDSYHEIFLERAKLNSRWTVKGWKDTRGQTGCGYYYVLGVGPEWWLPTVHGLCGLNFQCQRREGLYSFPVLNTFNWLAEMWGNRGKGKGKL